jgi:Protein of unknown function (DUF1565)
MWPAERPVLTRLGLAMKAATALGLASLGLVVVGVGGSVVSKNGHEEAQGPPPPGCSKFAAPNGSDSNRGTQRRPFATPQRLAEALRPGQTGCLVAGTYDDTEDGYVLRVNHGGKPHAPITLRGYPPRAAKLVGIVNVPSASDHVRLSNLTIEGTGDENTVKVYAVDVTIRGNDITNASRGRSCLILGNNSESQPAVRTVVRLNRFYDCGASENGNEDHAIYAANVRGARIADNLFWGSAAYAIQFYPNARNMTFAHNVVDGDEPSIRGGVVFGGDADSASRNNKVERNVIAFAATYAITSNWDATVGSGNLARFNCVWRNRLGAIHTEGGGFTARGNVVGDPRFIDRAHRDYRLGRGTRCRKVVGYDTGARLARRR